MEVRKKQTVCEWQGVSPVKPEKGSTLGIAIDSLDNGVLHGLRHSVENDSNGWYIWSGEFSKDSDFFKPICIEHLVKYLPKQIIEYLDLPPGYRFLVDGNSYEDVWFDEKLLDTN